MTCPACSSPLEPLAGKVVCSNPRCFYTETCSDGGCMPTAAQILEVHPFQECPKCFRLINTLAIEHHCIHADDPRLSDEPPSTAESDFATLTKDPIKSDSINGKEITICSYCNEGTKWDYAPDGYQWICGNTKCRRINTKIDHIIYDNHGEIGLKDIGKTYAPILTEGRIKTIYLSGPMTGLPNMNKNEFDAYVNKYSQLGFKVISPANSIDYTVSYETHIRHDVRTLLEDNIDAIYLLPNWQKSEGSQLEVHLAKMFKIPIFDAETGEPWNETITQEAYRLVYGDRQKTYNNPLEDFSRTAGIINAMLRHKLSEELGPRDIALIMMAVKLSRLTNKPDHRDSCVDIGGYAECYWWVFELEQEMQHNKMSEGSYSSG